MTISQSKKKLCQANKPKMLPEDVVDLILNSECVASVTAAAQPAPWWWQGPEPMCIDKTLDYLDQVFIFLTM